MIDLTFAGTGPNAAKIWMRRIGLELWNVVARLKWVDRAGLFIAIAVLALMCIIFTTLLIGLGRLDDARLDSAMLGWLLDAEFFFTAPLWLLLRVAAILLGILWHRNRWLSSAREPSTTTGHQLWSR